MGEQRPGDEVVRHNLPVQSSVSGSKDQMVVGEHALAVEKKPAQRLQTMWPKSTKEARFV